jgi:ATP-binding cassette subfamily E protein 1
MPFSVREGINVFLAGFVPTENLRFRDEELNFKMATSTGKRIDTAVDNRYCEGIFIC